MHTDTLMQRITTFYLIIKLIVVYQMSRNMSNIENLCQQEMEVL